MHRRLLSRNTNKMQLCNRIYYSKVFWTLNMFRAAHRSSSGALNCICSLWFIHTCGDRPLSRLSLGNGRSPHVYINQRLKYSLELLMMSGVPLETHWAFNKLWSNKFSYKVASGWLFLLIHTTIHGSMNIKFKKIWHFTSTINSNIIPHFRSILVGLSIYGLSTKIVHTFLILMCYLTTLSSARIN